jgi:adenylate cyclase
MVRRYLRQPLALSLAVGLVVFAIVVAAQRFGWLQRWELAVYDELIRARAGHHPAGPDERIAIIGITEEDLIRFGHPLNDDQLAALIEKVRAAEPGAIGIDLYRNLPEPRAESPSPRLASALRDTGNLVAIFSLPDARGRHIPGPPSLADMPDRLAFNDFPVDKTVVRRGLLFATAADGETYPSFALSLALLFLQPGGIEIEPADAAHPQWIRLGKTAFHPLAPTDGAYAGADTGGYQFLLDFKGPQNFSTYSYGDVMEARIPPDALRDKVVLIGTNAESVKDSSATPLAAGCRGVVLHAQAINQLLRAALLADPQVKVWPDWVELLWNLIWACGGAVGGLLLMRRTKRATVCFLCAVAGLVWITRASFFHDWWIPAVAPALSFVVSAVGSLGLVYSLQRRERRELMNLFSRHVSGKVAQALWDKREKFLDGNRPLSQKLTATVLFTDFVGFSTVSEDMEPAAVMDWLNTGMGNLARQVEANDGVINKYIGDAIMALFGVPVARTTEAEIARDARNAVRCALAMSEELEKLNQRWVAEGRPIIGMRIGIQTGPVVAGCVGSASRLEFTVIGDTVNTAARLESTRKDEISPPPGRCCRILIGESTHAHLGDLFEAEFVGEETLKGKVKTIRVYRVSAERIRPDETVQKIA